MSAEIDALLNGLLLDDVVLEEASVSRGAGERSTPGSATSEFQVKIDTDAAPDVVCLVTIRTAFADVEDERIATIELSHVVRYGTPNEIKWDEETGGEVGRNAVSHAAPFAREMLSDLTSKMDLPRYLLPLIRPAELRVTNFEEDA